jgi:hypothetical protein
MKRIGIFILVLAAGFTGSGQDLNFKVSINAEQIQTTDRAVFKDMERAFANFLNTRKWTNDSYGPQEKINCTLFLNITKMPSIGNFVANAQVTSARPVYNSNYETVLLNFADREWEFEYIESPFMLTSCWAWTMIRLANWAALYIFNAP